MSDYKPGSFKMRSDDDESLIGTPIPVFEGGTLPKILKGMPVQLKAMPNVVIGVAVNIENSIVEVVGIAYSRTEIRNGDLPVSVRVELNHFSNGSILKFPIGELEHYVGLKEITYLKDIGL